MMLPCKLQDGEKEVDIAIVTVPNDGPLVFSYRYCGDPTQLVVKLEGTTVATVALPNGDEGSQTNVLTLPLRLNPGIHRLTWTALAPVQGPWATRAEVHHDGAVRFRFVKASDTSEAPALSGFVFLEVLP